MRDLGDKGEVGEYCRCDGVWVGSVSSWATGIHLSPPASRGEAHVAGGPVLPEERPRTKKLEETAPISAVSLKKWAIKKTD